MEYTVIRTVSGTCQMSNGLGSKKWEEPRTSATIFGDGRRITRVNLNACLLALPEGAVQAMEATDEQIVRAVLGDEHIFSGAPSFPDHYDNVQED